LLALLGLLIRLCDLGIRHYDGGVLLGLYLLYPLLKTSDLFSHLDDTAVKTKCMSMSQLHKLVFYLVTVSIFFLELGFVFTLLLFSLEIVRLLNVL